MTLPDVNASIYALSSADVLLLACPQTSQFSTELCTVLVGKGIPDKIVRLPEDVLGSPGDLIGAVLDQLEELGAPSEPNGLPDFEVKVRGGRR